MMQRWLGLFAIVVLLALHNDWWAREPALEPVLGFIPFEIAYRLAWLVLVSVVLSLLVRWVWPRDERP